MMENPVKVAAAQVSSIYLDIEKTIEKACEYIREAANNGAKLVVFPEAFVSGYPDWTWLIPNSKVSELNLLYNILYENAISVPDKYTETLARTAREHEIFVVIGINERNTETSTGSLFNSILYLSDQGEILGVHRKLIPTAGERLIWAQGDGSDLKVFDTKLGRIGGLICWENFMPLARNAMYVGRTQIYVAPTWDKSQHWLNAVKYIAKEGGMYVISSCQAMRKSDIPDTYEFKNLYPQDREWVNIGNSCIVNPMGKIISGPLEKEEGLIYAEVNQKDIISSKRLFDVTGHYSRPDVFSYDIRG